MEAISPHYKENFDSGNNFPMNFTFLTDTNLNFLTIKNVLLDYCARATFENIIISDLNFSSIVDTVTSYSKTHIFLVNSNCSSKSLVILSVILKSLSGDHKILIIGNEHLEPKLKNINFTYLDGYLSVKSGVPELVNAIQTVQSGRFYFDHNIHESNSIVKERANSASSLLLSERELQIAKMFIEGQSNREICNALDLKPSTISTFKRRLLSKLDLKSLMDLRDFLKID